MTSTEPKRGRGRPRKSVVPPAPQVTKSAPKYKLGDRVKINCPALSTLVHDPNAQSPGFTRQMYDFNQYIGSITQVKEWAGRDDVPALPIYRVDDIPYHWIDAWLTPLLSESEQHYHDVLSGLVKVASEGSVASDVLNNVYEYLEEHAPEFLLPPLRHAECCHTCYYRRTEPDSKLVCGRYTVAVLPTQVCDSWQGRNE